MGTVHLPTVHNELILERAFIKLGQEMGIGVFSGCIPSADLK